MTESRKQKDLVSVRVTTKFKKQLEDIAEDKGMTLPDYVRFVLANAIEEYEMKIKDN
jgi:antitoxin component of RelBE/YafQ-DinJ toxin-antitoxin module